MVLIVVIHLVPPFQKWLQKLEKQPIFTQNVNAGSGDDDGDREEDREVAIG